MKPEGSRYVACFLSLAGKLSRADTLQYLLVQMDDILALSISSSDLFFNSAKVTTDLPYTPLIRLLSNPDEYVQLMAGKVLTVLVGAATSFPSTVDFKPVFTWIATLLGNTNANLQDLGLQYLDGLLTPKEIKPVFWATPNAPEALANILKTGTPNAQTSYQAIYAFWLLSYDPIVAGDINKRTNIVPEFIEIAKNAIKEKVIRIIVATFRNLALKAPDDNIIPMLGAKLLPFVETLQGRKWTDAEIVEDLEYLKDVLSHNVANLTTWDEYYSEVKSGHLDWSPPHLSENFWKNNVTKLNDRDHELLKALARLMATSKDSKVLAVACHDIGQYVKFYPEGKKFVQEVGAKQHIMELMANEDSDVRYNALLATQKYMEKAWN
ncbi:ARM repeat-containing protein [Gonapodya prolifera JEL478]|uniref:ARM repeat-containing protein n=1 Tax=Gonapodya prolifera (strain JEL478) TaxID=1344416 RepID=A0A139AR83_GONPJ|nr:ARM repeat-containing protein [Gonapodya prolifera JEL478]|eukprot:KXS19260.1 ARM repeat-containing protein [Gonapodya prolifera JEL478]